MKTTYRNVGLLILASLVGLLPLQAGAAVADQAPAAEPPPERGSGETGEPSEEMIRSLAAAVEADPDDVTARLRLGMALHDANRKPDAVVQFEKALELEYSVRTLTNVALAYAAVSRFGDAERAYRSILELIPNYPPALHNLGNMAYKRGEDEEAIVFYRKAITADPDYSLAYFQLGKSLNRLGRHREAYAAFERVLAIEPHSPEDLATFDDSLYEMASLDIEMGAHERAAELLALLISENPKHDTAYYAYGQVLLHLGRVEEAQQAFEKHMKILTAKNPTDTVAAPE